MPVTFSFAPDRLYSALIPPPGDQLPRNNGLRHRAVDSDPARQTAGELSLSLAPGSRFECCEWVMTRTRVLIEELIEGFPVGTRVYDNGLNAVAWGGVVVGVCGDEGGGRHRTGAGDTGSMITRKTFSIRVVNASSRRFPAVDGGVTLGFACRLAACTNASQTIETWWTLIRARES